MQTFTFNSVVEDELFHNLHRSFETVSDSAGNWWRVWPEVEIQNGTLSAAWAKREVY